MNPLLSQPVCVACSQQDTESPSDAGGGQGVAYLHLTQWSLLSYSMCRTEGCGGMQRCGTASNVLPSGGVSLTAGVAPCRGGGVV